MTARTPGGVWRHVTDLAQGLMDRDFDVILGLDPEATRVTADAERKRLPWIPLAKAAGEPSDVWHLHLHDTYERAAFRLIGARARRPGVRIATEHLPRTNASDPSLLPGARRRGSRAAKSAFKHAQYRLLHRVIAVSAASRSFLILRYGVRGDRIVVVPNGVAVRAERGPGPRPSSMQVVAAGSLIMQKGFDVLAEAVALSTEDWSVAIAGEGPGRGQLEALAAASGDPSRMALLGWRDDIDDLMLAADLVCIPSRWEAAPYVALDAMAACKPVVASAVDGLPEVVTAGVTGTLVRPEDPHALASALDAYSRDPERRRLEGLQARRSVESTFALEVMLARTVETYRAATGG